MIVQFRNHYKCDQCRQRWVADSESQPDDRCPQCDTSISPHMSENILELYKT